MIEGHGIRALSVEEKEKLNREYPQGSRVQLVSMTDDPYSLLLPGDLGTVKFIGDSGSIHISWNKRGSLTLPYGEKDNADISIMFLCFK